MFINEQQEHASSPQLTGIYENIHIQTITSKFYVAFAGGCL